MKENKTDKQINQQIPDDSKRKQKIERIAYWLFVMVTTTFVFTVSIIVYVNYPEKLDSQSYTYQFSLILNNWQQNVITDIVKSDNLGSCPDGFSYLFEYDFKSTSNGCNCINITGFNNLYNSTCLYNQSTAGCTNVNSIGDQKIHNWNYNGTNASFPFTLCAKRLDNNNFMSITTQCTSDQRLCGGDDSQFKMCIDQNQKCPINEISFSQINDTSFETIQIYENQSLYISRTYNNYFISEFRVTGGPGVCLDNNQQNIQSNRPIYKLSQQIDPLCEIDYRFKLLDKIGEYTFFASNKLDSQIQQLPQYQLLASDQYSVGLYARRYLQFDQKCMYLLETMLSEYQDSLLQFRWEKIILIYTSCDSIVIFLFFGTYYLFSKSTSGYHWAILIFESASKITECVLIIIMFVYVEEFYSLINLIINQNCSTNDHYQQKVWLQLQDQLNQLFYPAYLSIFVVYNISLAINLIILFVICKNKGQISQQKQPISHINQWRNNNTNNSQIIRNSRKNSPLNSQQNAKVKQIEFQQNETKGPLLTEANANVNGVSVSQISHNIGNKSNIQELDQKIPQTQNDISIQKPINQQKQEIDQYKPILPTDLQQDFGSDTQEIQNIFGIINFQQDSTSKEQQISTQQLANLPVMQQQKFVQNQQFMNSNNNSSNFKSNEFATFGSEQSEQFRQLKQLQAVNQNINNIMIAPSTPRIPSNIAQLISNNQNEIITDNYGSNLPQWQSSPINKQNQDFKNSQKNFPVKPFLPIISEQKGEYLNQISPHRDLDIDHIQIQDNSKLPYNLTTINKQDTDYENQQQLEDIKFKLDFPIYDNQTNFIKDQENLGFNQFNQNMYNQDDDEEEEYELPQYNPN